MKLSLWVQEQESRSRRARKPKQHAEARTQTGIGNRSQLNRDCADHPILKRKRVQRDLSSVILGRHNEHRHVHWSR